MEFKLGVDANTNLFDLNLDIYPSMIHPQQMIVPIEIYGHVEAQCTYVFTIKFLLKNLLFTRFKNIVKQKLTLTLQTVGKRDETI